MPIPLRDLPQRVQREIRGPFGFSGHISRGRPPGTLEKGPPGEKGIAG